MPSAPPNPFPPNSRSHRTIAVLIGDDLGAFPASDLDVVRWLKPLRISRPMNGAGTHEVELQVLLKETGHVEDTVTPTGHDRIVEVREIADDGTMARILGWGKIASEGIDVSRQESVAISARIDPQMFGDLLTGTYWRDDSQSLTVFSDEPPRFNPTIDGRAQPNFDATAETFGDVSAHQTKAAADLQGTLDFWLLSNAVLYVLARFNATERFVTNPTLADLAELSEIIMNDDALSMFDSVPEMLDSLLTPYGYWWSIESSGDIGSVITKFVFGKLGEGVERSIPTQRIGETMDGRRSHMSSNGCQLEYDIVTNPNVIIGHPAVAQCEVTMKLYPAWGTANDADKLRDINGDNHVAENDHRHGELRNVGRKWVVGEAGDYTGLRPEFVTPFVFPATWEYRSKRRQFLPAITLDVDGKQIGTNGYRLQYWDAGGVKQEFDWGFSILGDELGILIESNVPAEVWDGFRSANNANKYLELTACVATDQKIGQGLADRRPGSPNGQDVALGLDLSDRFATRFYETDTTVKSIYADDRSHQIVEISTDGISVVFIVSGDQTSHLVIGQTVAITDDAAQTDEDYEGEYSCSALSYDSVVDQTSVSVIADDLPAQNSGSGDYGRIALNSNAESCIRRVQAFCERARDDQDHALVSVNVQLHGIDHPQIEIGNMITGLSPRAVNFDAFDGSLKRYPQVTSLTYNFNPTQTIDLSLEQYLTDVEE
tara:strand:- start:1332 stop:3479 length:2148 start_codon:yes stop_codon:yes gene_type:complete